MPLSRPPVLHLLRQIGGGLPGKRRVGRADACAVSAVAGCAGGQIAGGIALVIEALGTGLGGGCSGWSSRFFAASKAKPGIISRNFAAICAVQIQHNAPHHGMVAAAIGIIIHLAVKIARIKARKTGDQMAIAFAAQPVAGGAGGLRAAVAATKSDDLAGRPESALLGRWTAGGQKNGKKKANAAHAFGTNAGWQRFPWHSLAREL